LHGGKGGGRRGGGQVRGGRGWRTAEGKRKEEGGGGEGGGEVGWKDPVSEGERVDQLPVFKRNKSAFLDAEKRLVGRVGQKGDRYAESVSVL